MYVFKHVWNSELDTIREMKKQLNYASPFLMNFKFNWERETFAYIQIKVSKARPVCERFFKTEQRDVRKRRRHHYCKGQTGV